MNKDQALNILKQFIDAAIKNGVCTNLESTAAILQAWQFITTKLNQDNG